MRQVNPVMLNQLKADSIAIQQLGSPLLACQGMLVPRGLEDFRFLVLGCPRPIVSNNDPADVMYAGGYDGLVPGPAKTKYTGSLQLLVTEAGHDQMLAEYIVANGGSIDCDYYDGRIDSFTRAYELLNCAIRFESGEFASDSKSQTMMVSCPIDYNYFGSFANIGGNGSIIAGQRKIDGMQGLLDRVQGVINTAQAVTNVANNAVGVARQVGALFR